MIRRTLLATLLLLVLLLALLLVGFVSPYGLNAILWTTERFVPELKVGHSEGALLTGFTLSEVHYATQDTVLNADALNLTLSPKCLRHSELCVENLSADGLTLSVKTMGNTEPGDPQDKPSETANERISFPFPVYLKKLELNDIALDIAGNRIHWQKFRSAASFSESALTIEPTVLSGLSVSLPEQPEASSSSSSSKIQKSIAKPSAYDRIVLPAVILPLDINIKQFEAKGVDIALPQKQTIDSLMVKAKLAGSRVDIETVNLDAKEGDVKLSGTVRLDGAYPLTLDVLANVNQPPFKGLTLRSDVKGELDALAISATVSGAAQADFKGKLDALDPDLPFDILLNATKLNWPLSDKPDYQVSDTQLTGSGSLKGYTFSLKGETKSRFYPPMTIDTKAEGSLSHLSLTDLTIDTLKGRGTGKAGLQWGNEVRWQAALNLDNIYPGEFWQEAEGRLSGDVVHDGGVTQQGGWFVNFPRLEVNGELRQLPFFVEGSLTLEDRAARGQLRAISDNLIVSHGPNKVALNGVLDEKWDLELALNASDLSASIPDAKGNVSGTAKFTGSFAHPEVVLDIGAGKLGWQDITLASLSLKGKAKLDEQLSANLVVNTGRLKQGELTVDEVAFRLNGNEASHSAVLTIKGEPFGGRFSIKGAFEREKGWQATFSQGLIHTPVGNWTLSEAFDIDYDKVAKRIDLSQHCWQQADSQVCLVERVGLTNEGHAKLTATAFPLRQVNAFLPSELSLDGVVNGFANVKWGKETFLDANFSLPPGSFTKQQAKPLKVGWDSINLVAKLDNTGLKTESSIDLTDNGTIRSELTFTDLAKKQKAVSGFLKTAAISLHPFAPFIGDDAEFKGSINSDITIGGNLEKPQLTGSVNLSGLKLSSPDMPIEVRSGDLTLALSGDSASLDGKILTPEGNINIDGKADWKVPAKWSGAVDLTADTLDISVPPMVQLRATPVLSLNANQDVITAKGKVDIPWARIVVESLPDSAVTLSNDTVMLDDNLQPIPKEKPFTTSLDANIEVTLGDDVTVDAFGLKSNLTGLLKVANSDRGVAVVGAVDLKDGTFRSFGQDLVIRKGVIRFNGVPDQPYLQVEAIRNPDTIEDGVTAGIRLDGPADEPQVTVFSDPVKSQANAISYLTRGRALDAESQGSMSSILIGLALAQGGKAIGQIGEAFGIENLTVDTKSNGESEDFEVSGYVLPGLQVKYGLGDDELTIRYRVMKDLYLEAMSGINKTVDLIYQFNIK